jgi:hypothetical protein
MPTRDPSMVDESSKTDTEPVRNYAQEAQREREEFARASRERAEAHERKIEQVRARRAREIEALEQELAQYKNVPGDEEVHE